MSTMTREQFESWKTETRFWEAKEDMTVEEVQGDMFTIFLQPAMAKETTVQGRRVMVIGKVSTSSRCRRALCERHGDEIVAVGYEAVASGCSPGWSTYVRWFPEPLQIDRKKIE